MFINKKQAMSLSKHKMQKCESKNKNYSINFAFFYKNTSCVIDFTS